MLFWKKRPQEKEDDPSRPRTVSAAELRAALAGNPAPQVLDVREQHERANEGWIAGAIHIPMGDVPERLGELSPERPVVVYCAHGVRSWKVACFLAQQGFKDVSSLDGGFADWDGETATS